MSVKVSGNFKQSRKYTYRHSSILRNCTLPKLNIEELEKNFILQNTISNKQAVDSFISYFISVLSIIYTKKN